MFFFVRQSVNAEGDQHYQTMQMKLNIKRCSRKMEIVLVASPKICHKLNFHEVCIMFIEFIKGLRITLAA